jgi:hypothetical protein
MSTLWRQRECGSSVRSVTRQFIELNSQPHASTILASDKKYKVHICLHILTTGLGTHVIVLWCILCIPGGAEVAWHSRQHAETSSMRWLLRHSLYHRIFSTRDAIRADRIYGPGRVVYLSYFHRAACIMRDNIICFYALYFISYNI